MPMRNVMMEILLVVIDVLLNVCLKFAGMAGWIRMRGVMMEIY